MGDSEEARCHFEQALDINRRLAQANPANAQSQRDLSISLNRLGDILVAIGDLEAARRLFEQALDISRRLADADPASAQSQRDLSISLNRLGDIRAAMGDLEGRDADNSNKLSPSVIWWPTLF